jgi:hypothetical protein
METEILLKEVFDEESYIIIKTSDDNPDTNIFEIKTNETQDKLEEKCLLLEFFEHHIFIDSLDKCGTHSGTSLLEKIDELVMKMPDIKYTELKDGAEIYDDKIRLAFLKILSKGQSWYNSLGYFSSNYENEINHNELLRNMLLQELLDKCKKKLQESFKKYNTIEALKHRRDIIKPEDIIRYPDIKSLYEELTKNINNYEEFFSTEIKKIDERIESLKKNIKITFPGIDSESKTKDFFEKIDSFSKENPLNNEQIEILEELLKVIGNLILYDFNLKKDFTHNNQISSEKGGKKQTKKVNRKKQTKKVNRKKQTKKRKQKTPKKMYLHP